jgi:hypothetical protein
MPTLSSNIVKRQIASVTDVEEALARQAVYGGDLATNLLELSSVSEARLVEAIAESLGLEAAPAGELPCAPDRVRRLVPGDVAQRYGLCPLDELDGKLVVAVSEPLPLEVVSDLEFSLGLPLVQHASTLVRVQQALARDYGLPLDQRVARVLANIEGRPDPHPSVPVLDPPPLEAERFAGADASAAPPAESAWMSEPAQAEGPPTTQPYRGELQPRELAAQTSEPQVPEATAAARVEAAARAARLANIDLFAFARRERKAPREKRRRGPYTLAMAEEDLLDAETRDEVVSAFFDFAAQYFEYSALFAVLGDIAEGRNAHGAGAPRAKVQAIGVPLDLPSTLAEVAGSDAYRLVRLAASGIDGALAKDLERRPGPLVLILPVRVRQRTVLVFYGDHGGNDVALEAIGDVLSFAPLVAAALERLILRRKERARNEPDARVSLPRRPRAELPTRGERASALAQALESSAWSRPPAASRPPEAAGTSAPPVARPVISVGPSRAGSMPVTAPLDLRAPSNPALARPSLRPVIPTSRTPIPSSFAPNAPPHEPSPITRKSFPSLTETDQGWDDAEEPHTKRGLGDEAKEDSQQRELETTQRYRMPADEIERALAEEQRRKEAQRLGYPRPTPPENKVVTAPPQPVAEVAPPVSPPRETADALAATARQEAPTVTIEEPPPSSEGPALTVEEADATELREDSLATESGDLGATAETLGEDEYEETTAREEDSAPLAPMSRSIAHSARPLPIPGSSVELRLPAVIVDIAQDTEDLVARLLSGDENAANRLVQIGAAAVPSLVGAFPGPITSELRRGAGEGPPRASDCGPLLKVLARIGPKAAGVLAVRSNDKDSTTRAWATRLLGEMPCLDAARAITRRFVDDDAEVRRAALAAGRMLQAHPGAGAVLASTLSEMLLDSTRQDRLQHMVIEAIADLREARAVPALATLLATGSPEIQRSAHWALVVLARTDYADNAAAWDEWWRVNSSRHRIEWLIDALMHESQEIRRAAGDELKSLTKEYFGYYDDLPARERERAQKRYRDWWDSKGKARFM